MRKTIIILLSLMAASLVSQAQIRLPEVITDNMVLQQGKQVTIWGEAAPMTEVTVQFMKQKRKATADQIGRWKVILEPMEAVLKPQVMTIRSGKHKVELNNILVGEVWLASGQSNMEYSMNNHTKYAKPRRGDKDYQYKAFMAADSPMIRVLHVKKQLTEPLPTDGWKTLTQESLAPVSAAGYFFAEHLSKELNVPVGIISSAWGGTPIEHWISEEAFEDSPIFENQVAFNKLNGVEIARRYDKMIAPIAPFAM